MTAWSDEPTEAQLAAIRHLIKWKLPAAEILRASDWLEKNATRQEVSYEMGRLRKLYMTHKLTKDRIFEGEIWEGFEHDGS